MKRLIVFLLVLGISAGLFAGIDFYGQARSGLWYEFQDEDYTGGETKTKMDLLLYRNSRLGFNFTSENYFAKAEIGFSTNVVLRHLYGEYSFKDFKLLAGKTFTGFADFGSQVVACVYSYDNLLIGYGLYYDGSQPQIRLSLKNGLYFILMQPQTIDPAGLGSEAIDAVIPKLNLGYKANFGNIYVHPTFGINLAQYNKDMTGGIDESILAYVGAVTLKYQDGPYSFKAQINFGQNTFDYGIRGCTAVYADADVDSSGVEIYDIANFGGYAEIGYMINDKTSIKTGFGYNGSDSDKLDETDGASTVFFQVIQKLADNVILIPEVGLLNDMEDGMGNKEGARSYFGAKLQMNFAHK